MSDVLYNVFDQHLNQKTSQHLLGRWLNETKRYAWEYWNGHKFPEEEQLTVVRWNVETSFEEIEFFHYDRRVTRSYVLGLFGPEAAGLAFEVSATCEDKVAGGKFLIVTWRDKIPIDRNAFELLGLDQVRLETTDTLSGFGLKMPIFFRFYIPPEEVSNFREIVESAGGTVEVKELPWEAIPKRVKELEETLTEKRNVYKRLAGLIEKDELSEEEEGEFNELLQRFGELDAKFNQTVRTIARLAKEGKCYEEYHDQIAEAVARTKVLVALHQRDLWRGIQEVAQMIAGAQGSDEKSGRSLGQRGEEDDPIAVIAKLLGGLKSGTIGTD